MDFNIYYVGQANFTMIVSNKKCLIYDCGTKNVNKWIYEGNFRSSVEKYFKSVFKDVKKVLVVISHNDSDHKNLLRYIKTFFKANGIYYIVICNDNEDAEEELKFLRDFFHSDSNSEIDIKSYCPLKDKKNKNRRSIVLKITRKFQNGETYSFMLTGDADENSLKDIIYKYYIRQEKNSDEKSDTIIENVNNKENDKYIKEIFSDVICLVNPHHGSLTNNSKIWSFYTIKYSKYPPLILISSNPQLKNGKPILSMIEYLVNNIEINLENNKNKYNKFYCAPHTVSCNLNSNLFNYLAIKKGIALPIFITYDSISDGYKVIVDSNSLTLRDDIVIFDGKKINEPLYKYSTLELDKTEELNKVYINYLAFKGLKEYHAIFKTLPNEFTIKKNISLSNLLEEKDCFKNYQDILEKCTRIKEINNTIYKETKSSLIYLNKDDNIDEAKRTNIDAIIQKYNNENDVINNNENSVENSYDSSDSYIDIDDSYTDIEVDDNIIKVVSNNNIDTDDNNIDTDDNNIDTDDNNIDTDDNNIDTDDNDIDIDDNDIDIDIIDIDD